MAQSTAEAPHARLTLGGQLEYGLARLTLGSKDFVSLTQQGYEAILHARASLFECLFVEQKFDLVVANYTEFETTLLDSTVQHMGLCPESSVSSVAA